MANKIHCYSYVTHFDKFTAQLESNPYLKVNLIGLGNPWNGFMDKIYHYFSVLKQIPDDAIVLFVDGFDTFVVKEEESILNSYQRMDSPIVISRDLKQDNIIMQLGSNRIFNGSYFSNKITTNSGLIIGRCKELKTLYQLWIHTFETKKFIINDDQVILNHIIHTDKQHLGIKIDEHQELFCNIRSKNLNDDTIKSIVEDSKNKKYSIIGLPGMPTLNRFIRAVDEYGPIFYHDITVFIKFMIKVYFAMENLK